MILCTEQSCKDTAFEVKKAMLLLLCLLWSLVEIHSLTEYPCVSFMGETLPNHGYVDLSLVGSDYSSSVHCNTDLETCCNRDHGDHRGNWIYPANESELPLRREGTDVYQYRSGQRVDLRQRNNTDMPSGIYRCDIPTNAVHDDSDLSVKESVYVGLYASGGMSDNT